MNDARPRTRRVANARPLALSESLWAKTEQAAHAIDSRVEGVRRLSNRCFLLPESTSPLASPRVPKATSAEALDTLSHDAWILDDWVRSSRFSLRSDTATDHATAPQGTA